MAEIKGLQDFFDPTKAMSAYVGMQHLALQNQQLGLQQQQAAAQNKNLEIDNLQKALQSADPMQSYPIQKQLNDKLGLPTPEVNEYYANLPYNKRIRGAQKLGESVGIKTDPDTAALIEHSGPLQAQIGNAAAQSPLQQAKADLINQKVDEHERLTAHVNQQLATLIPSTKALGLGIERSTPHVEALAGLQQEYDKNVKAHGITKAAQMKNERIALNPDLQQFNDRRQQSIPKLQQSLQQIEDQQSQLETQAELIARGAAPLPEGHSIETLAAAVDHASRQRALTQAQLAFAKDPSKANLGALQALKAQMDETVVSLSNSKTNSQAALDLHRAGLDEKISEHKRKNAYEDNVVKAQIEMAQAGDQKQAAAIAKKYNVKVDDILPALKDPNNPGVVVKMPGTTEEAGKFSMIDNAVKNIDSVVRAITKSDGSIDRQKVFNAALNIPFTEGRELNSMMEDAISAKLRAETGAAANAEEVKSISRRFNLSTLDKDEVIKSKLSRLRRFLNETRVIRDTGGKIRESAAKGEVDKATAEPQAASPNGTVAPFDDAEKERRYQEWKKSHK